MVELQKINNEVALNNVWTVYRFKKQKAGKRTLHSNTHRNMVLQDNMVLNRTSVKNLFLECIISGIINLLNL